MRSRSLAVVAALAGSMVVGSEAVANFAISLNPNACISSLSAQLLKKPRSQAGNKKNVWDADPPEAATSGMHYFVYNMDETLKPRSPAQRSITLQSGAFGPGYTGSFSMLVRQGSQGQPFFLQANPDNNFNLQGLEELGVARVTFTLTGQAGFIDGPDEEEIAYKGYDDDQNPNTPDQRGFEHARFATENLPGTEFFDVRGLMTGTVPDTFNAFAPAGGFEAGFLSFGGNLVSTGANLQPALVVAPEPATLVVPLVATLTMLRRSRAVAR